ncbi:class IV lanthionine synthetase LanL [Actinoplanes sp. N902-109]|uniref:class IV lanthionine synthetase LanL n=1 Tax=Actinoplanes sp. (strain N902-109) TaxID=649831 RepID=UPI000329423A|nr:class IV lanthionine synthetase LanL [Actinoplanes sp. N902-109]AGL14511.1 putative serine/threonine protein kinase [Actinoplanes sp. N902-109]
MTDDEVLTDCLRAVLRQADAPDWRIEPGDFWCHAQPPGRRLLIQGWKLHISATPLAAPLVLSRVARVLVRRELPFKFARTLDRVRDQGSRLADRAAGGKFITVYPGLRDDELRDLAEELHRATLGLPGPGVLSDRVYRPGSLVHYRYGVHGGVPMLNNDGLREAMLVAPDGSLATDERKPWYSPPAWAPRDPFDPVPHRTAEPPQRSRPRPVLLGGRYEVHKVIRHDFPGSVYRATDRVTGTKVIVKQGRPHAGSDLFGEDVRDRRRHEAEMLRRFAGTGITAGFVDLFEQQGDLFLVQAELTGVTLRQWVSSAVLTDTGEPQWGVPVDDALRMARELIELVGRVHREGWALRDLSPNNVMVTSDGLRLIDLEALVPAGAIAARLATPGYAAPELRATPYGPVPITADLYALGAVLFHLGTAVDPVLLPDDGDERPRQDRLRRWLAELAVANPAARLLAPAVAALTRDDPARRPGLDDLEFDRPWRAERHRPDVKQLADDAIQHLIATMDTGAPRLWAPGSSGAKTDPLNVQHGAAGVLGVLTRAFTAQSEENLRSAVAAAAGAVSRRAVGEPRLLPGLHYGRSGTAWALLDAGVALADPLLVDGAADLAARVPLAWPNPDVCHGTAGAGLTQLRFWEATGRPEFLDRAVEAAGAVADVADQSDGGLLWRVPADFSSLLAGAAHHGFAHGTAGIATLLLAVGRTTGDERFLDLAGLAGRTLRAAAEITGAGARWAAGPGPGAALTHWCSGSSGVGTFLVRLWQHDGDDRWLELLDQAARAVHGARRHAGPGQCHGLAGDADFLLDLAEATGRERYRSWAEDVVTCIYLQDVVRDGRTVVPDESRGGVLAEFSGGLAGVLALLLRLRDGGPRMWLPGAAQVSAPGSGRGASQDPEGR